MFIACSECGHNRAYNGNLLSPRLQTIWNGRTTLGRPTEVDARVSFVIWRGSPALHPLGVVLYDAEDRKENESMTAGDKRKYDSIGELVTLPSGKAFNINLAKRSSATIQNGIVRCAIAG